MSEKLQEATMRLMRNKLLEKLDGEVLIEKEDTSCAICGKGLTSKNYYYILDGSSYCSECSKNNGIKDKAFIVNVPEDYVSPKRCEYCGNITPEKELKQFGACRNCYYDDNVPVDSNVLQEETMRLMRNKLEEAETKKARLARLGVDTSKLNTLHKKLVSMVMDVDSSDELLQALCARPSDRYIKSLEYPIKYRYVLPKTGRYNFDLIDENDAIDILKLIDDNYVCGKILTLVGDGDISLKSLMDTFRGYFEKYPDVEKKITYPLYSFIKDMLEIGFTPQQVVNVSCKLEKDDPATTSYEHTSKSRYLYDLFDSYKLSYEDYMDINKACPDHYFILDELLGKKLSKEQIIKCIPIVAEYIPNPNHRALYPTKTDIVIDYVLNEIPEDIMKGLLLNTKIEHYNLPYGKYIAKLLKDGEKPEDILASILSDKYSCNIFQNRVKAGKSLKEINQEYIADKTRREEEAAKEAERLANRTPEEVLADRIFELREKLIDDLNSFSSRLEWDANEIYDNCAITESESDDYEFIEIFVHLDSIDSKPYYTVNDDNTKYSSARQAYKNKYWTTNL